MGSASVGPGGVDAAGPDPSNRRRSSAALAADDPCATAAPRTPHRPEDAMKPDIHPEYKLASISCSCGNTFETHATVDRISVELCNQCHPFYTGKQKLVDTGGRVDRFKRRMEKAKS